MGIALVVATGAALAQATGTVVGVNPPSGDTDIAHLILNGLMPTIVELAVTVISVVGILLARKLDALTGLRSEDVVRSIEAKHRDALQSAIANAAGAALAKYGPSLKIDPTTPEGQFVLNLVNASVPEARNFFQATDKWITDMANAKLALNPATPTPLPTALASP